MKALHVLLFAVTFSVLVYHVAHGEEIVNGEKANENSFQYMVSVQEHYIHKCGGFLINFSHVLTAAHCDRKMDLTVVIGTHNIDPEKNNLDRYKVQSKHIHPSYRNDPINGFDIMLLKLSRQVDPNNEHVKTIGIPSKYQEVKSNVKCQVAGWGSTGNNSPTETYLRETDVFTIDLKVCTELWLKRVNQFPSNILCAGGYETKHGACQGDSGGPLVCNQLAVGIVSFNYERNCSYPDVPNVYTDISAYVDWINSVIKEDA